MSKAIYSLCIKFLSTEEINSFNPNILVCQFLWDWTHTSERFLDFSLLLRDLLLEAEVE